MKNKYYKLSPEDWNRASSKDLIMLELSSSSNIFIPKHIIEVTSYAIINHYPVHISGPTGSGKTSVILGISENFKSICSIIGQKAKPIKLYPNEVPLYETPQELFQRRSIKNGETYDEHSALINNILKAKGNINTHYPVIWLRELGGCISSSVLRGLLNIIDDNLILPSGDKIDISMVSWITDSNYLVENSSVDSLVELPDPLKRRLIVNIAMNYLSPEEENLIINELLNQEGIKVSPELQKIIWQIINLGNILRDYKSTGELISANHPTIDSMLAMVKMKISLPYLSISDITNFTLFGSVKSDEKKLVPLILSETLFNEFDKTSVANIF